MSEQLPSQQESQKLTELTHEQLANGYLLQRDEAIAFEVSQKQARAIIGVPIGNGMELRGTPVAEVMLGTEKENARGVIVKTGARGPYDRLQEQYSIVFGGQKPFASSLTRAKMSNFGRLSEGQENFPLTVSRDHCAIGVDDTGRIVIENHTPSNFTFVRTF